MNNLETLSGKQNNFVNEFKLGELAVGPDRYAPAMWLERLPQFGEHVMICHDLLHPDELNDMNHMLDEREWQPVGINGMSAQFNPESDYIGSYRASAYSPELAAKLWDRLLPHMPAERHMHDLSATDWDGSHSWRPVGVNPLMRFIQYKPGGVLIPHYDAPFVASYERRSLMSLVVYLDKSGSLSGGATRFIRDPQAQLPVADRDLSDWPRFAHKDEVVGRVEPAAGSALLFDHRILHDGELVSGTGRKLLLRTDIEFERI